MEKFLQFKYFTIIKKIQPKYDQYETENNYIVQKLSHYTWSPIHEEKELVSWLEF